MSERDGSSQWTCPKPMLAYALPKGQRVEAYGALGWIAEPKVDGIRITLRNRDGAVLAWSRPGPGRPDGKVRQLPAQVTRAVASLPDGVYDGELAVPGRASWDAAALDQDFEKVFFAFDVLELLGQDAMRHRWSDRRQMLELAMSASSSPHARIVPVVPCTDEQYDLELETGGEGLMVKHPDSVYRPGARTKQWLKVKPTERAVLFVEGYKEAIRGPHATLRLIDMDGNRITVGTPSAVMQRADRDAASLLGRPVVVKYQIRTEPSESCPTGSYRHPRMDKEQTETMWREPHA
jgi:ATP-dependent DNA ligase